MKVSCGADRLQRKFCRNAIW